MKKTLALLSLITMIGFGLYPEAAYAVSTSEIPPKRLLLFFPLVVVVIICILLLTIKRK